MSVYGERAGALSVVCASRAEAELVLGQLKATVRRNYSSPAIHAAGIVSRVLTDPALRASWQADVAAMRERILAMRRRLHGVLAAKLPDRDFGYFLSQRGMFSYTGLIGRAGRSPARRACGVPGALGAHVRGRLEHEERRAGGDGDGGGAALRRLCAGIGSAKPLGVSTRGWRPDSTS